MRRSCTLVPLQVLAYVGAPTLIHNLVPALTWLVLWPCVSIRCCLWDVECRAVGAYTWGWYRA